MSAGRWFFSRRRRAAIEAWTAWSPSADAPMPLSFEAGFHLGFSACRRASAAGELDD